MAIQAFNPTDKELVKKFISLPWKIYEKIPQWVPLLSIDQKTAFNSNNPFFRHSKAQFFISLDKYSNPNARIVIINNKNYNEYNQEKTAFFWMFECKNDIQLAQDLFSFSFEWAKAQGLNRVIGPKGFTPLDGSGLLIRGFQHLPAFGLPYNPDYYPNLIESVGFVPKGDSLSGYLSTEVNLPEKIHKVAELVKTKRGLEVASYKSRKDLRNLVPKLKDLYNDALGGTAGNVPITNEEADMLAKQLLRFADPTLIKIVFKNDEPIGFLFAYPDVSRAIQEIKGRVFPFGWWKLLQAYRKTEWVNVNGAGIAEKHRGTGGTAILFDELQKSIQSKNFKHADLVQIAVDNDKMQRELRDLGIDFYKTHRIYEKDL